MLHSIWHLHTIITIITGKLLERNELSSTFVVVAVHLLYFVHKMLTFGMVFGA